ncbi:MAG TPA: alpha/beta fold hydrolase [Streptosporangiales bacterium]
MPPPTETTVVESDLTLDDGRILHVYDTGDDTGDRLAVFWHHGTPNIGSPPRPLFAAAERLGVRWVAHDRPGYGGSTALPGRDIASAAADVARIADALGVERFAVMGHSGGATHALACGALLPDRVVGVVGMATIAPYAAAGLDWFVGMARSSEAALRSAAAGRAAREAFEAAEEDLGSPFTPEDDAMFSGEWGWLIDVVRPALASGPAAQIDDDLAYVAPWGCSPADIAAPVLLVHGDRDRVIPFAHAEWLARRVPGATLWRRPGDGHISVLTAAPGALAWLADRVR